MLASMTQASHNTVSIVHNRAPSRIRFLVPIIKNRATFAELLKQNVLKDPAGKGVYHAEPNITTATLLVKYHPGLHSEADVLRLVSRIAQQIAAGQIEFSAKHKNPRLGKMPPAAFFTRELAVSIVGNVLGGILLAAVLSR